MEFIKKLWNFFFHTEKGLYLVFGALTTLVSLLVGLPLLWLGVNENVANLLKNIAGIIFAYITNRIYVFGSTTEGDAKKKEIIKFFVSRAVTTVLDMLMMYLLVMVIDETVAMILSTVIVIVLNYVFSKLFVFTE